jgi:hypothetical protein
MHPLVGVEFEQTRAQPCDDQPRQQQHQRWQNKGADRRQHINGDVAEQTVPAIWLYESAFWSGGAMMTGLIFWMGVVLILVGGLWLASDCFEL